MTHSDYIQRCIQLAKNGLGTTYPNPMVGSVIVYNNKIIGEGWHYQAGKPHAEVNAINSIQDKSLLKDSTIYVSLEPCSHFGKTPPCSDLIIESGIKKVVIGTIDPFAKVAGRGIERLKNAGCDVTVGILENECQELNKRFFTYHNNKRPYIFLKWAQSADHFLSPEITENQKREPIWITNTYSKQQVHKQRANEQAILVGTNTVIADNPSLSTRTWFGKNCTRIVLDLKNRIPNNSSIFDGSQPTIILTTDSNQKNQRDLIFEIIDPSTEITSQICDILYKHQIQSLIIEGGKETIQTFIDVNLWDEAYVYSNSKVQFKNGTKAPFLNKGELISSSQIKTDTLTHYIND